MITPKYSYIVRYDSWMESFIDSTWDTLKSARKRKMEYSPKGQKKITIIEVVRGKQWRPGTVVE